MANSVIPVGLITTSFGQQFEPSLIPMPLGFSNEVGLNQNEENPGLHDNILDGSSDFSTDPGGKKEVMQHNIAYKSQDIDSQSGTNRSHLPTFLLDSLG